MQNAKNIISIIAVSLLVGATITFAWNSKTIEQQIEEHNQAVLADCLTKARIQKTTKEILEYASNCNKDILTNISTPRSVETITGTGDIITKEEQECIKNTPDRWSEDPVMIMAIRKCNDKYGTHSTGNTVQPLGFQLIPTAGAKSVESASKELQIKNTKVSTTHSTIGDTNTGNVRTPKQIYEQVKHLGYSEDPTISLISTCKASSGDPRHCILVGLVLMYNEAGNKQNSKACIDRNNCFGIKSGKAVYSSLDEGMENWVQKYNKYWFKAESAGFFYSSAGKVSKSRYCTSEDSSKSSIGCPHGLSIATAKWKQLTPIIYE